MSGVEWSGRAKYASKSDSVREDGVFFGDREHSLSTTFEYTHGRIRTSCKFDTFGPLRFGVTIVTFAKNIYKSQVNFCRLGLL